MSIKIRVNQKGNKILISVLSPSIRPQYLEMTQKCLERQTFTDFEWITEIGLRNRGFTLPTDMNKMLERSQGDIIVSLQDCIDIPDTFLQHVYDTHSIDFVTYPIAKKDGESFSWDWRHYKSRAIEPQEWEADLASAPRQAFFDVGGYNEAFCNGWSWENVEVAYRAEKAGYTFRCDNTISGIAIDHDKEIEHPFRNKGENNDWRAELTKQMANEGDWKLDYLKPKSNIV